MVKDQEGRKEMFYLMTHSTHFIYSYMVSDIWKEGNALFNDALNTFYLRLYGHMVKDHSDSEKENPLPPHRLLLSGSFIGTSCRALAGTRNSSMGPPHEGSIRRPIAP